MSFSISQSLRFGWQTYKSRPFFLSGLILFAALLSFIPSYFSSLIKTSYPTLAIFINLITWAIQLIVSIGLVKIYLNLVDNKTVQFSDLFAEYRLFLKYLITALLVGLIVLLGLALFVIPGIILAIKLQFATYFVVDKQMGPLEALRASWAVTSGVKFRLFLLSLGLGLVNILGMILLIVGIFVSAPVTMLALAWVYRQLSTRGKILTSVGQ